MSLTLNAASVTDAYGNPNAATTAAAQPIDTKPPSVSSVTPANQSSGVTVGTDIVFTFSEAIAKGTGNITLTTSTGATVATCPRRLNIDPPCRFKFDPGRAVAF